MVGDRFDLRFALRPTDDPDLYTANIQVSRDLRNVSSRGLSVPVFFAVDEWCHARRSQVLALNCSQDGAPLGGHMRIERGAHDVVGKLASKIRLKPNERMTVIGEAEETRHANDAWILTLTYATADPRVTVEMPDDMDWLVIYGFS